MKFFFATCSTLPNGTADDNLVADVLKARGHDVEFHDWREQRFDWSRADKTVIRSTWDYQQYLKPYLEWAQSVPNLVNDAKTVEWNCNKRYLTELDAIESHYTKDAKELPDLFAQHRAVIVKPTISASANLTFKATTPADAATAAREIIAKRGEAMIQPFIESIAQDGEISLIFFNGEFSHAVLKTPALNDFRVQKDFGGKYETFTPNSELIAFARKNLRDTTYARVDIVDYKTAPKIGELELIEPELYFRFDPQHAPARLAEALLLQKP